jgi:hypothetical protein
VCDVVNHQISIRSNIFALPGIVAFLIAALALAVIYMDELQTKLKDQRGIRWIVATVLIAMGVGAFVSDKVQRNEEQRTSTERIRQTAIGTANELSPKVAAETASRVTERLNKDYGDVIGGLYREIARLETEQQNQFGLAQKQMSLKYAPSLDIIYAGEQLQLWNRGNGNVYLWGNKYNGYKRDFSGKAWAISPGNYYYLLTNYLNPTILAKIGKAGEDRVSFDLYISTEDKKKYIVHAELWEIVKDGQITIHTQNHGYEAVKDWPSN